MIDKSIKQHYDNKYSAKNRRRYFTGAYGGPDAGRGRDDPSPSSSGNGGWSPSVSYSPPAPAPTPHVDTAADLMAEATRIEAERKAIEKAIQEAEQREITGDIDELADFTGFDTRPKVDVKDIMGEVTDPGSVSYDPTYKTPAEIRTLSQDPDYGQFFRQPTMVETPKSGIMGTVKDKTVQLAKNQAKAMVKNKFLKELGLAGINPILGIGSWLLGKFAPDTKTALTEKIKAAGLRSRPKDMPGMLGDRGFRTSEPTKDDSRPDVKTVAEQITKGAGLESGQEMLGLPDLQKRLAILNQLKQNKDFWSQLTDVQKRKVNMAMMNYFKLIDQYSVKPNQGRVRDIG